MRASMRAALSPMSVVVRPARSLHTRAAAANHFRTSRDMFAAVCPSSGSEAASSPSSAKEVFERAFGRHHRAAWADNTTAPPLGGDESSGTHASCSTSPPGETAAPTPSATPAVSTQQSFSAEDTERYEQCVEKYRQYLRQDAQLRQAISYIEDAPKQQERALHEAWQWVMSWPAIAAITIVWAVGLFMVEWRRALYANALSNVQYKNYNAALEEMRNNKQKKGVTIKIE